MKEGIQAIKARAVIRTAVAADAGQITELLSQLGYRQESADSVAERISNMNSSKSGIIMTAEAGGAVIGFIALAVTPLFHQPGPIGRITAFCVHEHYRSRGVGEKLLNASEGYFTSMNCSHIEVTTRNTDVRRAAHAFYRKKGFIEKNSTLFYKQLI